MEATGQACNPDPVFERFTERARQVVVLAQEEARTLRHPFIGTEHLLLGLLRDEDGVAARALAGCGVTLIDARRRVDEIVTPGAEVTHGQMPFTPRSKRALELALREAQSLGSGSIGTEHLLLALARDTDGVATRVILDLGADFERVANAVRAERAVQSTRAEDAARGAIDWDQATLRWHADGIELSVPVHLVDSAEAAFIADETWGAAPLSDLRRRLHGGRLTLHSPSLLDDIDPRQLRPLLDSAADRATKRAARDFARRDEFLRQLRESV
ncbi:MAG: Clp protease N-terminal domain-containing protein [Solirubrobacteraceae bacterium]